MKRFFILVFVFTASVGFAQDAGNALHIQSGDDFVQLPANMFSSVSDYTIEFWIYADQYDDGHIFDFGNNVGEYISFQAYDYGVGSMEFTVAQAAVEYSIVSDRRLSNNIWHHIAITFNSVDGNATLYVDGEIAGSNTLPLSFNDLPPTANNYFGRAQDGSDNHWYGAMDEFRFWTKVKTQQEVKDQMFEELAGDEADLFTYYNFNTGVGNGQNQGVTTLYDITTNGNHGTLNNFGLGDNGPRWSNWIISDVLSMAAWHPFTDGFVDDRVAGNGGVFYDPVFQTADRFGIAGSAIDFQGGYVESDLILNDGQAFSISVWVNWDGSLGFQNFVSWYDGSLNGRTMLGINGDNGGEIRFGDAWPETGVFINANEWTHIIATYDGNSTARIYLNGYEQTSNNTIAEYNFKQTTPGFYIGTLEGTGENFSGQMDDVRIYDVEILKSTSPVQGTGSLTVFSQESDRLQLHFPSYGNRFGVVNVRVESSTDPDSAYSEIAFLNGWEEWFLHENLTPNTSYWYRLFYIGEDGSEVLREGKGRTFSNPYSNRYEQLQEAGATGDDYGRQVATDSAGNMYFAGSYTEEFRFYLDNIDWYTDNQAIYVIKMDPNYNMIWNRTFEVTSGSLFLDDLQVGAGDEVYLSGTLDGGEFTFAGTTITSLPETAQMVFFKLDKDGNELWNTTGAELTESWGGGLEVIDGFVYAAYEAYGNVNFAGVDFDANGAMLLKYDTLGNEIWGQYLYTEPGSFSWSRDVASDGDNVYLSIEHYGSVDVGGVTYSSNGEVDIVLAKLDKDGNVLWSQGVTGTDGWEGYDANLALDSIGNVFMSARFSSSEIAIGGTTLSNSSEIGYDVFISKFNSDGELQWAKSMGGEGTERVNDIESDGSNIFITGYKPISTMDFGDQQFYEHKGMYVAMYNTDGALNWVDLLEGNASGTSIVYSNDNLFVTGYYRYTYNWQGVPYGNYDPENYDVFFGKISSLVPDSGGPVITMLETPTYLPSGENRRVRFDVVDPSGLSDVSVWFGSISLTSDNGDLSQFNGFTAFDEGGDTYYIDVISSEVTDPMGVQYFVSATDAQGNVAITDLYYMYNEYYDFNSVNTIGTISQAADRGNLQESDFRIFAPTLETQTVAELFVGNSEEYAVFNYNGSTALPVTNFTTIDVGKGYWMIYTNQAGINNVQYGRRPQVNNTSPFQITLNSGWTQIGNPYPFEINWGQVLDFNVYLGNIPSSDAVSSFFSYRGAFNDEGSGTIRHTEGGFVRANEAYTIVFPFPGNLAAAFGARTARKGTQSPLDAEDWKVNINLENQITSYNVAAIGMKPEASLDYDMYDIDPLPYMNDYLEFNSRTEDNKVVSQSYVKTTDGHIWDFEATTSHDAGASKLTWDHSTFGENDRQLYLYDVAGNRVVNMREQSEYKFTLDGSRTFKVLFGNQAFIDQHLKSDEVSVTKAYPNPFKDVVNIPFSLPTGSYSVKAQVFNQVGSLVTTIHLPGLTQGVHEVRWDGTNNAGQEMNEGIYYYKIRVEGNGQNQDFKGKVMLRR